MPPRKKKIIEPANEQAPEPAIEPVIEPVMDLEELSEDPQPIAIQEDTVTFKRSHFYAVLTVLAFAAGILLGYVVWGMDSPAGTALSAQTASQSAGSANGVSEVPVTQQPQYTRYDIPTQNSYSLGPADAPITIVEFSDYECPFCRRWHAEVYKPLLAAYPGKIRLVYRNLPLTSIHPDALAAAEAAMCAGEQDVYWKYHDKLFSSESLGNSVYLQYAQDLGLNMNTFKACLSDHKYQKAIETDSDFAINLGIRSTPTFFINGLAMVGAQPLDVFKQVIDKELAGEIPK
jgi:protein-disulfide isomerase